MAVTFQCFHLRWYKVSPEMWSGPLTGLIINKVLGGVVNLFLCMHGDLVHQDWLGFPGVIHFFKRFKVLWGLFVQILRETLWLRGSEWHLSFCQQICIHLILSLCEINSHARIEPRSLWSKCRRSFFELAGSATVGGYSMFYANTLKTLSSIFERSK